MIEFVQGDIFDFPVDIRVNTVNCVGAMGAGVALAFKKRYPEMFKDYQRACKGGEIRPGRMHVWKSLEGVWIVNFPTKRDWRESSRYEDIDLGLDDLRKYLDSVGPVTIALPALGCGNGGLDWSRISEMIRRKLEGVNAHVYVFEPAASRRAGKAVMFATDDERKRAEQLGYDLYDHEQLPALGTSSPIYVMGESEALSLKWIAVFASRSPSAREMQALEAISIELASLKYEVCVALVHDTKSSEEIAELFSSRGIRTVLLLPFGVLTRKPIAKRVAAGGAGTLTIASTAPASEKWSRKLHARSMDALRLNSVAVLLSDPEADWILNKELSKWNSIPVSYVRYEITSSLRREKLDAYGARSIGRRGKTGTPNIDFLLSAFDCFLSNKKDTDQSVRKTITTKVSSSSFLAAEVAVEESQSKKFNLEFSDQTFNKLKLSLELLREMEVAEISVRFQHGVSDEDYRRLLECGFSPEKSTGE